MEIVEKRGSGEQATWRIRYRDNPGDPMQVESGFATYADARQWLKDNPALPVDDEDDGQE